VPSAHPLRQRVLDAACDVIINDGVPAATLRAVAARAALDAHTIEELYSSQEELLVDVLNREYVGLRRAIAEDVARDPQGGLVSRIFHYALSATYERPLARALYVIDPEGLNIIMRATHGTAALPRLGADRPFLERLQRGGMIRGDVDIASLTAILSAFMYGSALAASAVDIDDMIAGLVMLMERSVDADVTDTEVGKSALFALFGDLDPDDGVDQ
jgi:AcrR family transcriptional regulator